MSIKVGLLVLVGGLLAVTVGGQNNNLTEKFSWKQLDFAWSSAGARQEAMSNGNYIPNNNLILAFDIWQNKIFVTVPRWRKGVVSSLNYIDVTDEKSAPALHPFPSWQMNELETAPATATANRTKIVSSFGIRADECDRLWVVDSGLSDILGTPEQIQSPSIVIFNLRTEELIRRFEIPSDQTRPGSFFVNILVDVMPWRCDEGFAYITDVYQYGVIVYDFKYNKSWRVDHNYFAFDPLYGNMNVGGVNFQWHDGIFGMALGDLAANGERTIFFHAMVSLHEFSVPNSVLKDKYFTAKKTPEFYKKFKVLGTRGEDSQSTIEVFDPVTKVVFYTLIAQNAIGCYNTKKPFSVDNQGIVARDDEKLIFPNDLRVDGRGNLYILSDRLPVFMFKTLDPNDYNFRIFIGSTRDLIKGTPCE